MGRFVFIIRDPIILIALGYDLSEERRHLMDIDNGRWADSGYLWSIEYSDIRPTSVGEIIPYMSEGRALLYYYITGYVILRIMCVLSSATDIAVCYWAHVRISTDECIYWYISWENLEICLISGCSLNPTFIFARVNINGYRHKFAQIQNLLLKRSVDLLAISETKLDIHKFPVLCWWLYSLSTRQKFLKWWIIDVCTFWHCASSCHTFWM